MSAPWTFGEAVEQRDAAKAEQERIEAEVRTAYAEFGKAQKLYAVALARHILELKASGMAVTACETVAKGDPEIAKLREDRDIKEGLRESAKVAAWRANKDRDDTNSLLEWSMRRELAEGYAPAQPQWTAPRRAA